MTTQLSPDRGTRVPDRGTRIADRDTRVSERDTRIDVLRALALLTIFVDHVPGTAFEYLTYKNFGFSDAAEVFVLISGISVALAYARSSNPETGCWQR
jgi:hypothetical protein